MDLNTLKRQVEDFGVTFIELYLPSGRRELFEIQEEMLESEEELVYRISEYLKDRCPADMWQYSDLNDEDIKREIE